MIKVQNVINIKILPIRRSFSGFDLSAFIGVSLTLSKLPTYQVECVLPGTILKTHPTLQIESKSVVTSEKISGPKRSNISSKIAGLSDLKHQKCELI